MAGAGPAAAILRAVAMLATTASAVGAGVVANRTVVLRVAVAFVFSELGLTVIRAFLAAFGYRPR